jgi:hypothetical protein
MVRSAGAAPSTASTPLDGLRLRRLGCPLMGAGRKTFLRGWPKEAAHGVARRSTACARRQLQCHARPGLRAPWCRRTLPRRRPRALAPGLPPVARMLVSRRRRRLGEQGRSHGAAGALGNSGVSMSSTWKRAARTAATTRAELAGSMPPVREPSGLAGAGSRERGRRGGQLAGKGKQEAAVRLSWLAMHSLWCGRRPGNGSLEDGP